MMELKSTVAMMESDDYKERFKAEYYQLIIRICKLSNMVHDYALGLLKFKPTCPLELLQGQLDCMNTYKYFLEERAKIEGIDLSI